MNFFQIKSEFSLFKQLKTVKVLVKIVDLAEIQVSPIAY